MQSTRHFIPVYLGMKCLLHLRGRASELDDGSAAPQLDARESMRPKPGLNRLNVRLGRSEGCTELLRRKPMVEERRAGILLRVEQLVQRRLLLRAASQEHQHAAHRLARDCGSTVVCGARRRVGAAAQLGELTLVDLIEDTSLRLRQAREGGLRILHPVDACCGGLLAVPVGAGRTRCPKTGPAMSNSKTAEADGEGSSARLSFFTPLKKCRKTGRLTYPTFA